MVLYFEESFVDIVSLPQGATTRPANIPDSQSITGIELRLSRAFIINNKTPKFGPFPGFARLYLIVIVVSDTGEILQTLDLKSFAKVDDGEDIPIDKTIYYWKQEENSNKPPNHIHTLISVVKSKGSLRQVADIIERVKTDPAYNNIISDLTGLVRSDAFPTISNLLFSLADIIAQFLGDVEDKPLITWVQSYSDINGDWDQLGRTVKTRSNRFAELGLTLIIRDEARENLLQNSLESGAPPV